jgi:hypothetical protein
MGPGAAALSGLRWGDRARIVFRAPQAGRRIDAVESAVMVIDMLKRLTLLENIQPRAATAATLPGKAATDPDEHRRNLRIG